MDSKEPKFWQRLILVLTPLFIIGVVNTAIQYGGQIENTHDIEELKTNKVDNDVLLQYMQLNKEIQEAMKENVNTNCNNLKRLEKKLDDFIIKYLSFKSETRGETYNLRIDQSDLYEFYCNNGINPLHTE